MKKGEGDQEPHPDSTGPASASHRTVALLTQEQDPVGTERRGGWVPRSSRRRRRSRRRSALSSIHIPSIYEPEHSSTLPPPSHPFDHPLASMGATRARGGGRPWMRGGWRCRHHLLASRPPSLEKIGARDDD